METATERSLARPVSEVLGYRNDRLLQRYATDNEATIEEAQRAFEALKQFMVICAIKPGRKITSEPIDRMWHSFLLFTKDYQNFCGNYLGRFVHHQPFETASPSTYLDTRAFTAKYFGGLDEKLWPVEAKADCTSGCEE
jgi:hypothetical protein